MSALSDQDSDSESEAPESARGVGCVIAIGGGRGGVGKSLVSVNLATYLAQLGKAVILVDADPTGSNIHSHFGLSAATADPMLDEQGANLAESLVETNVPGLLILPAPHDAVTQPLVLRAGRKTRYLSRLRALSAEYLVIDVGPGHGNFALDLMLSADVSLAVTVPEPPAIETTYRFLRAAFRRRLRRALARDKFRIGLLERALVEVGSLAAPIDLVRSFAKMDRPLAELAWAEAQRMRTLLVVNQTRVRQDMDLGSAMSGLAALHYGVRLEELGHIEHDDTVWLTVRRYKPLLVDSPASKAARNLERIARRVLAVATARYERVVPTPLPLDAPSLYALLGIARSANDEEIRRAYKRQRETYATGGLATASLLSGSELRIVQLRLDEAFDTLLDPVRRRAYDLSLFPEAESLPKAPRFEAQALDAEKLMLQRDLAREIGPDTEFTGELLRKVRESQGIELADISQTTKIAKSHIAAIESEDFDSLPAAVYVRGFLGELAKYIKLDPAQVQKTYLRRLRDRVLNESSDPHGSRGRRATEE